MKCEICGQGPIDGVSLFRVNEKGVIGIWRCKTDLTHEQEADLEMEVLSIVQIIEQDNR